MGDEVLLSFRVVPGSSRNEVVGWHGDAIKIKIRAPALDGRANEAFLEYLSDQLNLSLRELRLKSGTSSRSKTVAIRGLSREEILRRLGEALC